MRRVIVQIAGAAFGTLTLATSAIAQQGPVATACKDDIPKLCAGKEHGQGEVRACLEANKDKVSAACKAALDSTGPGKGMGQGQPK
ncbi:MAG: cysteine rich repeat-containing protein [Hyphomicrobium sp.]